MRWYKDVVVRARCLVALSDCFRTYNLPCLAAALRRQCAWPTVIVRILRHSYRVPVQLSVRWGCHGTSGKLMRCLVLTSLSWLQLNDGDCGNKMGGFGSFSAWRFMTVYRARQTDPHSVPVGLTRGIPTSSTVEGSVFSTSGALMHTKGVSLWRR